MLATRELELFRALELQCRLQGPQLAAAETPQDSPGNPAACPSAPPAYQRHYHERQAPSAPDAHGCNLNMAATTAATTATATSGSITYAWAGPPASGRYSCPGVAAVPGQHLHLLGEIEMATSSCRGTQTGATGDGGGGDRSRDSAGGGGGQQRRSRSLLQLVPLSQSLTEDDQSLRRLQQQLYTVASPFASAAAAAAVDEQLEGEAGARGSQEQQSPRLPGGPEGDCASGAMGAEPPVIAAYSCAASLSLSLALMDEGDCEAGSGYGWLYSSDDEDYPSRATTSRSQCFPSPACNANSNAAKPRSTPPRATSSAASGASGNDLAQQLQSPLPGPGPHAAVAAAAPQQADDQRPRAQPHTQHRRRHRMSAPGRSSWCGWRSRPLPQPVPEHPSVAPSQDADDRTGSYRQQAAAALSRQTPQSGLAAVDTASGMRHLRSPAAGGNTAVMSVVRNLSAPALNVDDQAACISPPRDFKKGTQPHTGTDAGSELLTLLSLWT
ncbi:hypothetical protein HXX76_014253 [Chlamydomonas incerta]|uniref:Uncharacterized protein n=1 Tax=Chlamydomonas incerta TaxID=51695 RepID=A0A835SHA1_CHLIN|nr:hypothetical protein HXX76_014253 [Chlamydomonas incerta]|eukprot:KAG2424832.1 hypothetical protein HXX76_014253 [Chlamydomonas incerta]